MLGELIEFPAHQYNTADSWLTAYELQLDCSEERLRTFQLAIEAQDQQFVKLVQGLVS